MALIGVIEPGTVSRVLRSVAHAGADVLILFEGEGQSGHVLFEGGKVVMARLDQLTGDPALEALERWTSGHYSLLKRTRKESEARGHVLLNGLNLTTRRGLERWLKRNEWATSILGYPQHARQVITYIQPEVVLMHCPRHDLGLTCRELSDEIRADISVPPLLVMVEGGRSCPDPKEECVRIDGSVESLEALLQSSWPGTRFGVRQSSRERTARIYRPEAVTPARVQAQAGPGRAAEPEELTARDLLPMLMALLMGSALIWSVWWVVNG